MRTSLLLLVSQIAVGAKPLNFGSVNSIAKMSSLITMQVAVSSVNCLLKLKPRALKNSTDRFRSLMGRLTKILRAMI